MQQNNNLKERGQYKAALRSLKDKIPQQNDADGILTNWGTNFHEGSDESISVGFGEINSARETLAYMWLAASDPNMELIESALKEMPSRESCIEAEKDNVVKTLADIQRAHNDGSLTPFDSHDDSCSCKPGTWGRLMVAAPLFNKLTKLYKEEEADDKITELPIDEIKETIAPKIVALFKKIPLEQKIEFFNNYNAFIAGSDPDALKGYNAQDFSAMLTQFLDSNSLMQSFRHEWSELVDSSPVLSAIQRKGNEHPEADKKQMYITILAILKKVYTRAWRDEIDKIKEGKLNLYKVYEPIEAHILQECVKPGQLKANNELAGAVPDESRRLTEVTQKIKKLQEVLQQPTKILVKGDVATSKIRIQRITKEYEALLVAKNQLIAIIENRGRIIATQAMLEGMTLLKEQTNDEEMQKIVEALCPEIPGLIKKEPAKIASPSSSDDDDEPDVPEPTKAAAQKPAESDQQEPTQMQKNMFNTFFNRAEKKWQQEGSAVPLSQVFSDVIKELKTKMPHLKFTDHQIEWLKKSKGLTGEVIASVKADPPPAFAPYSVSEEAVQVAPPTEAEIAAYQNHRAKIFSNWNDEQDGEMTKAKLNEKVFSTVDAGKKLWFKQNERKLMAKELELDNLDKKINRTAKELQNIKAIDEVLMEVGTGDISVIREKIYDKYPALNDINDQKILQRIFYRQSLRPSFDDNWVNDLQTAIAYGSLEAQYALLIRAKYDPSLVKKYSNLISDAKISVYNYEFDLSKDERKTKSKQFIAHEVSKVQSAILQQLAEVKLPELTKVENDYLNKLEAQCRKTAYHRGLPTEEIKSAALNEMNEFYGPESKELQSLTPERRKALASGRLSYVQAMRTIATADFPGQARGTKYRTYTGALMYFGNAPFDSRAIKEQILIREKLELEMLEAKERVLNIKPDFNAFTVCDEYIELLLTANAYGSDMAALDFVNILLQVNPIGGVDSVKNPIMHQLQLAANGFLNAQKIAPTEFAIKDILIPLLNQCRDPLILAEAKKVAKKVAAEQYQLASDTHNNAHLLNAAGLGHPLAQLEVISDVVKNSEKRDVYKTVFLENIPTINNLHGDNGIRASTATIDLEALYAKARAIAEHAEEPDVAKANEMVQGVKKQLVKDLRQKASQHMTKANMSRQKLVDIKIAFPERTDLAEGIEASINEQVRQAREIYEKLQNLGARLKFEFVVQDKLKKAVAAMPVNPQWLASTKAQLEDNEMNIRLCAGAMQLEYDSMVNREIFPHFEKYLSKRDFGQQFKGFSLKIAELEARYYQLLEQGAAANELSDVIKQIKDTNNNFEAKFRLFVSQFTTEQKLGFEINQKNIDYLVDVFLNHEVLAQAMSQFDNLDIARDVFEANSALRRTVVILKSHDESTNLLKDMQNQIQRVVANYRSQTAGTMAQIAESVEPGKISRASKQNLELTKADTALLGIQNELQNPDIKGIQYFRTLAQRVSKIVNDLEQNLESIGPISKAAKNTNRLKRGVNKVLGRVGVELKTNKALSKSDLSQVKTRSDFAKAAVETLPAHIEAQQAKIMEKQAHKARGVFYMKHRDENVEPLYKDSDIELGLKFINTHLNLRDLNLTDPKLKSLFHKGVFAEIVQALEEPIIVAFKALDNSETITVEIPKHQFDQYIENQAKITAKIQMPPSPANPA